MIYLQQSEEQQTIKAERHYTPRGVCEISLINTLTRETYSAELDTYTTSRLYIIGKATLPIMPIGEYGYTITDEDGRECSVGLAVVGGYYAPTIETEETIEYRQYGE